MIVIALLHFQFCSRPDAAVLEKFEESAIAFVNAADGVWRGELSVGEEDQATAAPTRRAFHLAEITVRAGAVRS